LTSEDQQFFRHFFRPWAGLLGRRATLNLQARYGSF